MPCAYFIASMSLWERSCVCLLMLARQALSLLFVRRFVYVTLRYCFR